MRYLTKNEIISIIWEHICCLPKGKHIRVRSRDSQGLYSIGHQHLPKTIKEVPNFIKSYDIPIEKVQNLFDIFWS